MTSDVIMAPSLLGPRISAGTVHLAAVAFQPIAGDEVAQQVALAARHDPREVVTDPHALYFGAELGERTLVPDDGAVLGQIRYRDWR
jgi:hypothetical protein